MLEWEKECDKHMFNLTTLFWRTMAGNRLLKDDSTAWGCVAEDQMTTSRISVVCGGQLLVFSCYL